MAVDKLERQLGLLAALLHTDRPLRASEIQQRVEGYPDEMVAFRRSFERDKDDLRRLGVPLSVVRTESVEGSIDGYRVHQSDYYLHDLGLEPDEIVALSVARRLIRLEGSSTDDAIWKLGGSAEDGGTEGPELAAISMGPAVTQLHEAITTATPVSFTYRDEKRSVEPWQMAFRRGNWYLHGYDRDRSASRRFRLDRVEGAIELGPAGTATAPRLPDEGDRQPWQFGTEDEQTFTARVAVDATHARWIQHHLPEAVVLQTNADGSIELEFEVSNVGAFRSLILSLFDAAEVLAPEELRNDIISWLQGMVDA